MKLRRGFIKESEEYSAEFRCELGLKPFDPLHSEILADHLGIIVRCLSTHPCIDQSVKDFWRDSSEDTFSALTLPDGCYREILHNDAHYPNRQNANIAHEISHIILGHSMTVPILPNGKRGYDKIIEEEAKVLSTTLLFPKPAAVHVVEMSLPTNQISKMYTLSPALIEYRTRKSDARRYVQNKNIRRW